MCFKVSFTLDNKYDTLMQRVTNFISIQVKNDIKYENDLTM